MHGDRLHWWQTRWFVIAAVLAFGLHLLGKKDVALYDGSWSEWGADPSTPKETGPA